jgi:uncharacterized protein (TIGR03435 family)
LRCVVTSPLRGVAAQGIVKKSGERCSKYATRIDPPEPAPDVFAAVQDQLGLKLESARATLDILVIDYAARTPVEN